MPEGHLDFFRINAGNVVDGEYVVGFRYNVARHYRCSSNAFMSVNVDENAAPRVAIIGLDCHRPIVARLEPTIQGMHC